MRLTEAEHRGLRMNRSQAIHIPPKDPKPGAAKAKCPYRVGHAYNAHATIQVGQEAVRRETRVTVMSVIEEEGGGWSVQVVRHDRTDHPRLLGRVGKGNLDGEGYVNTPARALTGSMDPGEAVPESVQRGWAKEAYDRDAAMRFARIKRAREGVDVLWQGGRDERRAARAMTHYLDRLSEGDSESEAA